VPRAEQEAGIRRGVDYQSRFRESLDRRFELALLLEDLSPLNENFADAVGILFLMICGKSLIDDLPGLNESPLRS